MHTLNSAAYANSEGLKTDHNYLRALRLKDVCGCGSWNSQGHFFSRQTPELPGEPVTGGECQSTFPVHVMSE